MKRLYLFFLVLILAAVGLTGCNSSRMPDRQTNGTVGKTKLIIYTSFYPMYFLAGEIAGDKAEIVSLVPAGVEPHDWEPTAKTIRELQTADMFIYNGAGMETWAERILENVDRTKVKILSASDGLQTIDSDPHLWVSPKRIEQQAKNILDAVTEIDPADSKYYEANYAELKSKLDKLDGDIEQAVGTFRTRVFVVSHQAFGYLAYDYKLEQLAIRGVNPDDEPSPAEMARLVEECKKNNIKYIFFEKLVSPKLSETLAKEVGAQVLVLNDAAGLSEEDIKAGKNYITIMYENLENLKKALM